MLIKEAEKGIRYLCGVWARNAVSPYHSGNPPMSFHPSFSDLYFWLENNHSAYLKFKSRMGVQYMAEMWFDDQFKQNWRR